MIFSHALFSSFAGIEFDKSEADPRLPCQLAILRVKEEKVLLELNFDDVSDLAKAALEILLTSMLGETANVDFVRLDRSTVNTLIQIGATVKRTSIHITTV